GTRGLAAALRTGRACGTRSSGLVPRMVSPQTVLRHRRRAAEPAARREGFAAADTQVDGVVRALPGDPEPLGSPGRGIHPAGAAAPAADRVCGGGQPDRGRGDLRGPRFLRRIVAAVVGDVPPLLADNPRGD